MIDFKAERREKARAFEVGDFVQRKKTPNSESYRVGEDSFMVASIVDGWIEDVYGQRHNPANLLAAGGTLPRVADPIVWPSGIGTITHISLHSADPRPDAINPNHYKFGDVEVRQISGHLTSFGGQALQYVARATRLDGQNKGNHIEDLKKAIRLLEFEIERLEQAE